MENENKQETGIAIIPKLAQLDNVGFANQLIDNIKDGKVDSIMVHLFLKRMEAIQKALKDDPEVQSAIITSAALHIEEGKSFSYMGANMSLAEAGTVYDYSGCNDPLWTNLNEIFNTVKEMKTDREKLLKAAFPDKIKLGFTAPTVIVEHLYELNVLDCGEETKLNKPVKKSTTTLKVTLPKK